MANIEELPQPITRQDIYLHTLITKDGELPPPITRQEFYLNFLSSKGGKLEDLPLPVTREEMYLYELCKNPPSSGGGDNVFTGSASVLELQVLPYEKL